MLIITTNQYTYKYKHAEYDNICMVPIGCEILYRKSGGFSNIEQCCNLILQTLFVRSTLKNVLETLGKTRKYANDTNLPLVDPNNDGLILQK